MAVNARDISDAIVADVRTSAAVRRELGRIVDDVAETWRSLAPFDTGDFRASIEARPALDGRLDRDVASGGAYVGSVVSTDKGAQFIEHGTSRHKGFNSMHDTAIRYGGR
jgi:hypothetical protein